MRYMPRKLPVSCPFNGTTHSIPFPVCSMEQPIPFRFLSVQWNNPFHSVSCLFNGTACSIPFPEYYYLSIYICIVLYRFQLFYFCSNVCPFFIFYSVSHFLSFSTHPLPPPFLLPSSSLPPSVLPSEWRPVHPATR